MSAGPPTGASSTAFLARSLLRRAVEALAELPAEARPPVLAAVDVFLAAPSAATWLAAARGILLARREHRLGGVRARGAERAQRRGLDRLRSVDGELAEALAALPTDAHAGARLAALAALSETHRELAERVAAQAEAFRRQMAAWSTADEPAPRRAPRANRARPRRRARAR